MDGDAVTDLDANATAAPLLGVVDAVAAAMRAPHGNAASAHGGGRAARARLAAALDAVGSLVGAAPGSVVLTSGGTEANNAAIRHLARRHGRIVTSPVEHASVTVPLAAACCEVVVVPVDGHGLLDMGRLAGALTPGCAVAVGWANGETGVVQPVEAIAALCRRAGAALFVDAAQAVGRVPVDLRRVPIDLLSFSGHKLHGPTGTGALFVRDPERFELHRPRVRWDTFDGLSKADGGAEMDDGERGGAAAAAPGRERRMTAARKRDAVLRLLQGEPLELAARELSVTAADLTAWRDAFLEAGEASLKSRPRDDRDERIERLQSKLGEVLMDNELLCTKVERLEGGVPLGPRRSRR